MQFKKLFLALVSVGLAAATVTTKTVTHKVTKTVTTVSGTPFATCEAAVRYRPGGLDVVGNGPFGTNVAVFCGGRNAIMQSDCNFVLYSTPPGTGFQSNTANEGSPCSAVFTQDGDFQIVNAGGATVYSTGTANQNATLLTFADQSPHITIINAAGTILFQST